MSDQNQDFQTPSTEDQEDQFFIPDQESKGASVKKVKRGMAPTFLTPKMDPCPFERKRLHGHLFEANNAKALTVCGFILVSLRGDRPFETANFSARNKDISHGPTF